MSLRTRLTAGTALALALAICAGLATAYFVVRGQLIGEIDTSLKERQTSFSTFRNSAPLPPPSDLRLRPAKLGGAAGYVQFVDRNGKVTLPAQESTRLPTDGAAAVAAGQKRAFFRDATVAGTHLRIYTARLDNKTAAQIARPLDRSRSRPLTDPPAVSPRFARRDRARRSARPRRRAHDPAARAAPDARRRAHRQHRQPPRAHRRRTLGRARTARPRLQHDARRPDALGHRATAARRRRLARAPDAGRRRPSQPRPRPNPPGPLARGTRPASPGGDNRARGADASSSTSSSRSHEATSTSPRRNPSASTTSPRRQSTPRPAVLAPRSRPSSNLQPSKPRHPRSVGRSPT